MNESPKPSLWLKAKNFIIPKIKFATTSALASALDYSLYLVLVYNLMAPVYANIISASCGMLSNFILQKRFIFSLARKTRYAFALSALFSLIGLTVSTSLIYFLNKIYFFSEYQSITKLLVMGLMFFYNFYSKRFSFEKR